MFLNCFLYCIREPSGIESLDEINTQIKSWTRKIFEAPVDSSDSKIFFVFVRIICALEITFRALYDIIIPDFDSLGPSVNQLKYQDALEFWTELGRKGTVS